MSLELAGLVSYQGPLLGARYPLPTSPALTTSSTSSQASTSSHETSSSLDFSETAAPSIRSPTFGAMLLGDTYGTARKRASMLLTHLELPTEAPPFSLGAESGVRVCVMGPRRG